MKKDEDWKQKITKEWNDAADEEGVAADENNNYKKAKEDDNKSVVSYSNFLIIKLTMLYRILKDRHVKVKFEITSHGSC